jgi:hypothetical protein
MDRRLARDIFSGLLDLNGLALVEGFSRLVITSWPPPMPLARKDIDSKPACGAGCIRIESPLGFSTTKPTKTIVGLLAP